MNKQQEEKEELIELFGIHFETYYHLPPCAARILGLLIMNVRDKGMTFEELVDQGCASKSTISTNINLLLKLGKISYYTKTGDRKKYFMPSPPNERIQNHLKFIESEKNMLNRVKSYELTYPAEDKAHTAFVVNALNTYMNYLSKFESILTECMKEESLSKDEF
ncbi:hypothetical protein [Flavobacterium sp. WV_118_3]|jgi:hypothetical protein|uniref:GbsR/MarR family transcriptional regulator n=1 Tax=Flavobacterium sp. WV_118_3 TaxID=3151764 RepID=UPI0012BF6E70|nr:hypothetical protein [Flavobacterium sp.]